MCDDRRVQISTFHLPHTCRQRPNEPVPPEGNHLTQDKLEEVYDVCLDWNCMIMIETQLQKSASY